MLTTLFFFCELIQEENILYPDLYVHTHFTVANGTDGTLKRGKIDYLSNTFKIIQEKLNTDRGKTISITLDNMLDHNILTYQGSIHL